MDSVRILMAAMVGYLLGSISLARIVSKLAAPDVDITETEFGRVHTGLVSATAVSIHLGPRLGFLTAVMDMLKIAIPTWVFKRLYPGTSYFLVAATAGMLGHIWPLYYRFKGGRGMSAIYGGMFAIDWIGVLATSLGGMILGLFVVRDFFVAYMAGFWLLIPWLWFRTHDVGHLAYALAVNVILLVALIPELKQYIRFRREGKGEDLAEVMQQTGMGRGMYKMAKRFGLLKGKPNADHDRRLSNE